MKPLKYYWLKIGVGFSNNEILISAARDGSIKTIRAILAEGVDPKAYDKALSEALLYGQVAAVVLLTMPETPERLISDIAFVEKHRLSGRRFSEPTLKAKA